MHREFHRSAQNLEAHLNKLSREEILEKIVLLQYQYIEMSLSTEASEQSEFELMSELDTLYDEYERDCRVKLFANIAR